MRGIIRDTMAEMFSRKLVWVYGGITLLAVLLILLSLTLDIHMQAYGADGSDVFDEFIRKPLIASLGFFLGFLVFVTVMATAGIIPAMFRKGTADFYLSKPVSRASLYIGRLFGVWVVYGGAVALCGLLVLLTIEAVYGFFEWRLLYWFINSLVSLLVWLTITMLAGVLTGSTGLSIVWAFVTWVVQWGFLASRDGLKYMLKSRAADIIVDGVYYIIPKFSEMGDMTLSLAMGDQVSSWLPLWSTLLFGSVMVILAVYILQRKDY